MVRHLAATDSSIPHKPVLVPTWKIHCIHIGCKCVFVGVSEAQVLARLEQHILAKHQWPTHDRNGNYIANLGD